MVVREYLVENFGFDDAQLKTLGLGKQATTNSDGDWGTVQILIYPAGTAIPRDKQPQTVISSVRDSDRPVSVPSATEPKR